MTEVSFWRPLTVGIFIVTLALSTAIIFLASKLFKKYSQGFWLWLQIVVLFLILIIPLFQLIIWIGEFFWW